MLAVTLGDRHCSSPRNIRNVKFSLMWGMSPWKDEAVLCAQNFVRCPGKLSSRMCLLSPYPRRLFMSLSSFEAKGYPPCTSYSHLHMGHDRRKAVPLTCTLRSEQKGNTTAYTCLPANVRPRGSCSSELVRAPAGGLVWKVIFSTDGSQVPPESLKHWEALNLRLYKKGHVLSNNSLILFSSTEQAMEA